MRQQVHEIKSFLMSLTNLKSWYDLAFNTVVSVMAFIFTYAKVFVLDSKEVFISITVVVLGDFISGSLANIKQFETQKALKVVWYFVAYNMLAYVVLTIEQGFPAAFWLSETVLMPILTFQVISILKNLKKLGLIPHNVLTEILDKIDKHKDGE